MPSIVIVGAGNIGSRHLQGLQTLTVPSEVYIIDPSKESRVTAQKRWKETGCGLHDISYHNGTNEIPPDHVDVAIVSTPADVRYNAIKELLACVNVNNLILEKVLFQKVSTYSEVETMLKKNDVDTWVNCPRRSYRDYREIHDNIEAGPVDLVVTGNHWNLGSNAIHFSDLFGWITGSSDLQWNNDGLSDPIINNKQNDYIKFVGCLSATDDKNNSLMLRCFNEGTENVQVRISTPHDLWIVEETQGVCMHRFYNDGWVKKSDSFDIPYQSEMTGDVVQLLLNDKEPPLPQYKESQQHHIPLIEALKDHLTSATSCSFQGCPVT